MLSTKAILSHKSNLVIFSFYFEGVSGKRGKYEKLMPSEQSNSPPPPYTFLQSGSNSDDGKFLKAEPALNYHTRKRE